MFINQRLINLERNHEQYLLSQSPNSNIIMSDELIYMEDCVLHLINSIYFNNFLSKYRIVQKKMYDVHLYFFQTSLRQFFIQLAHNRKLFKNKQKCEIYHDKQNLCKCNQFFNNQCICLKCSFYFNDNEKHVLSLLVLALYYIINCWKNKKYVGIDIFELNYQPTLKIQQCGYEI